jgi:hypothetical protein
MRVQTATPQATWKWYGSALDSTGANMNAVYDGTAWYTGVDIAGVTRLRPDGTMPQWQRGRGYNTSDKNHFRAVTNEHVAYTEWAIAKQKTYAEKLRTAFLTLLNLVELENGYPDGMPQATAFDKHVVLTNELEAWRVFGAWGEDLGGVGKKRNNNYVYNTNLT